MTPELIRPPLSVPPVVDGALARLYREERARERNRWRGIRDPRVDALLERRAAVTIGTAYTPANVTNGTVVTAASVVLATGDVADVSITWRDQNAQTVASITYNGTGTGFTQIMQNSVDGERIGIAKYYLLGRTGTANLVVTMSSNCPGLLLTVQVLQGVDQITPVGTHDFDVDLGAETGTLTGNVTLGANDLAIASIGVGAGDATATLTHMAGQTSIRGATIVGATDITCAVSYEAGANGALGYTWDGAAAGYGKLVVVPYLAAAAGGGGTLPPRTGKRHRPAAFAPGSAGRR